MFKRLFFALVAVIVLAAETTPAYASSNSYITPEGSARMLSSDGIKAQWHTARQICVENGFSAGSREFLSCFTEYQLLSIRLLGARAKKLTDAVARRHNLCIDRQNFEIARCTEI